MELVTSWVADPDAARDVETALGPVAGWTVLLMTLGFMLLPAAIGVFVLLGFLS
jgi:hypothetical protein